MKVMVVVLRPVGRHIMNCPNEVSQALRQRLGSDRFHTNRSALGKISFRRQKHAALGDFTYETHGRF